MKEIPKHMMPLYQMLPSVVQKIIQSSLIMRQEEVPRSQELFTILTRILKTEKDLEIQRHPALQFMWGKTGYETSNYKTLLELYRDQKTSLHGHPFVIYALHRSGQLEAALQLCEKVLMDIKYSKTDQLGVIDLLAWYQALLAGAQAAAYAGRLEQMANYLNQAETLLFARLLEQHPTAQEMAADLELELRVGQMFANIFTGHFEGSVQIIKHVVTNLLPTVKNEFLMANFWNLAGNTYFGLRRMDYGRKCFNTAIKYARKCHDLRLEAAAKANLVNLLTVEAEIDEAIAITKEVLQIFEQLGDAHNRIMMMIALGLMHVSQQDLPSAERQADFLLKIFSQQQVSPDAYLLASMLFAQVHRFADADHFLDKVKQFVESAENKRLHLEIKIVEGVIESEKGNLARAQQILEEALVLSDRYKMYNFSLDILINRVINSLRYYLTLDDDRLLTVTWSFFEELRLLLLDFDLPSIIVLQQLIAANLLAARFRFSEAKAQLTNAKTLLESHHSEKLALEYQKTIQKINWAENHIKSMQSKKTKDDVIELLFEDVKLIQHYFARESLRILLNLSASKLELSTLSEAKPILLMLIASSGLALYKHDFQKTFIDEQMISSFLTAISSFSQNIFGSGMLRTIQHEQYFILLESVTDDLYLALITETESYDMRNKMRQFTAALREKAGFLDQLASKPAISIGDAEFNILEVLCRSIFEESTS